MNIQHQYLNPDALLRGDDFLQVESFLERTQRTNIGWHYIVDLTWIYSQAKTWPRDWRILDAGGGRGPAQFLLAEMGFDMVNLDLYHVEPGYALQKRYALEKSVMESHRTTSYVQHLKGFHRYKNLVKALRDGITESALFRERKASRYAAAHDAWRGDSGNSKFPVGKIRWLTGNLASMPELEEDSFDAVVSLSSLEHVPLDILPRAMGELRRVVKPAGRWAVTTSGTDRTSGWFHENSQGWCFSEADLIKYFGSHLSGAETAGVVLEKYRACDYLREHLGFSYRLSGKNGMPWGKWAPAYVPVALFASDLPERAQELAGKA